MQIDALQNTNCIGEISVYFYTKKLQVGGRQSLFGGCQFTFWRVPIYILEAEIVLGVLYRKGVIPQKGGIRSARSTVGQGVRDQLGPSWSQLGQVGPTWPSWSSFCCVSLT